MVYAVAKLERRILATFNVKHFRPLLNQQSISIVGLSSNLTTPQIDTKLKALMLAITSHHQVGKFFVLSKETKIKDLLAGD